MRARVLTPFSETFSRDNNIELKDQQEDDDDGDDDGGDEEAEEDDAVCSEVKPVKAVVKRLNLF